MNAKKLYTTIMSGRSDNNIPFDGLCSLLHRMGFSERQRGGSHRIFYRKDVVEIINIQPAQGKRAKSYQVKEIRALFRTYNLEV